MPLSLAVWSTLNSSNYPCLKHIFMVPTVLEPLKFYCNCSNLGKENSWLITNYFTKIKLTIDGWVHIWIKLNNILRFLLQICVRWVVLVQFCCLATFKHMYISFVTKNIWTYLKALSAIWIHIISPWRGAIVEWLEQLGYSAESCRIAWVRGLALPCRGKLSL